MGAAIDTIVFSATNPGAAGAAAAANAGDTLGCRNFSPGSSAYIDFLVRQGATAGFVEVKSPRMHDAVRGLHVISSETPSTRLFPPMASDPAYPGDTYTVTISGGAAEVDAGAFGIIYQDLPGVQARLYTWAQLTGSIEHIKPMEVDVAAQATSAGWSDTVITTTENLLEANRFYAVLGYTTDTAALVVGVKGAETGNLRICGPGPTLGFQTTDYFVRMSNDRQLPYIPVFNANNRAAYFVSTALVSTAATPKVELILALLKDGWTP